METDPVAEGMRWYRAGRFPEAERAFRRALDADPDDPGALAGAGAVALLHNRLDDATALLRRVAERSPDDVRALRHLAEATYRADDVEASAAWWRRVAANVDGEQRREAEVVARKLASHRGATPYRIDGGAREIRVPFAVTDPVPMIEVTLPDGATVPFLIDTGAHEVYVDQAVARDLQLVTHGTTRPVFAGGLTAPVAHAWLDGLIMGGARISDVPVHILDLTVLGEVGGLPVRGVIGTALLSRFLSTINYPGGALELRPRTADQSRAFALQAGRRGQHVVPFWLAGTHFVLAWGSVNGGDPMLLFADTGGAGIAFTGPMSTIERAGITLQPAHGEVGPGGGGDTPYVPFVVGELTLGDVIGRDLVGVANPDADYLKDVFGQFPFPVGGIVSHQFFRPYALTFDFVGMRMYLGTPP